MVRYVDQSERAGAQIVEMRLHWTMTHTFAYDGGSFCLGWHSLRNGMPSKLPSNASGTHFGQPWARQGSSNRGSVQGHS